MRRKALAVVLMAMHAGALWAGDGDLDPSFGFGGRWTWAAPEGIRAGAVLVAPDEAVVALGGYFESAWPLTAMWLHWKRFTDTAAGTTCVAEQPPLILVAATAGDFDSAGRLVVAGGSNGPMGGGLLYAARSHYPACDLDGTFDGDGFVVYPMHPFDGAQVHWVEVFPVEGPPGTFEDRILILGGGPFDGSIERGSFAVRLRNSGALDTGWGGGDGFVFWTAAGGVIVEDVADSARDGAGRMLSAGTTDAGDFWVSRRLPGGSPDPAFSGDGERLIDFGHPPFSLEQASALALTPDGRIVVAGLGIAATDDHVFAVARLLPNGALDPSFGSGGPIPGRVLIPYDPTPPNRLAVRDVLVQGDGRILIVGAVEQGGDDEVMAVRLTEAGALDPSFGSGGRVVLPIDLGGTLDDLAAGVALHGGRPVLVGQADHPVSRRGILLRLANALVFADGFESGGRGAWSSGSPP